jgi:hypothetical protein
LAGNRPTAISGGQHFVGRQQKAWFLLAAQQGQRKSDRLPAPSTTPLRERIGAPTAAFR